MSDEPNCAHCRLACDIIALSGVYQRSGLSNGLVIKAAVDAAATLLAFGINPGHEEVAYSKAIAMFRERFDIAHADAVADAAAGATAQ